MKYNIMRRDLITRIYDNDEILSDDDLLLVNQIVNNIAMYRHNERSHHAGNYEQHMIVNAIIDNANKMINTFTDEGENGHQSDNRRIYRLTRKDNVDRM